MALRVTTPPKPCATVDGLEERFSLLVGDLVFEDESELIGVHEWFIAQSR